MSGMTPERLQSIEDRLPGEVFPNSVEHDVLNLIDEVQRLRAGIEALASVGYSHTPDCEADDWQRVAYGGHPDCGLCWEDKLATLLNPPTEGETGHE